MTLWELHNNGKRREQEGSGSVEDVTKMKKKKGGGTLGQL